MLVKYFLKLLILQRTKPLQSVFLFETLNFIFMNTMIYMILICFLLFIKILTYNELQLCTGDSTKFFKCIISFLQQHGKDSPITVSILIMRKWKLGETRWFTQSIGHGFAGISHSASLEPSLCVCVCVCVCVSHSVASNSLRSHGLWPARLLCSWNSPGKNTGVGCHVLLQGICLTQGLNPGLLHCRQILYYPSHQGSPCLSPTT